MYKANIQAIYIYIQIYKYAVFTQGQLEGRLWNRSPVLTAALVFAHPPPSR